MKKLLTLCITLVAAVVFGTAALAEAPVWNGTVPETKPEVGYVVDESAKTVSISTADGLAFFAKTVNEGKSMQGYTVTLTSDIDLAGKPWTPIGCKGKPFNGTFEGGTHTISNLFVDGGLVNTVTNSYKGLFGLTNFPAAIKNVKINNATVKGSLYVGAVVGMGYTGSEISGCEVTGDIQIEGYWYIGGIGGNGYMNTVTNCKVSGNDGSYIKGTGSYVGGIWGFRGEGGQKITECQVGNLQISGDCYVAGITGNTHYGNIVENCTVTNCTVRATSDGTQAGCKFDSYFVGTIGGCSVNDPTYLITIKGCKAIETTVINGKGEVVSSPLSPYERFFESNGTIINNIGLIINGTNYQKNAATIDQIIATAVSAKNDTTPGADCSI